MSWLRNERELWDLWGRNHMSEVALVWVFAEATCDPVTVERQSGQSVVSGRRVLLGPKTSFRLVSARENRQPETYKGYIELGQPGGFVALYQLLECACISTAVNPFGAE
jgi:hypothetical protein